RTKDYYQLFAFFNNIDGPALDGNSSKWAPIVSVPTGPQTKAIQTIDTEIAAVRNTIAAEMAKAAAAVPRPSEACCDDCCEDCQSAPRADYVWVDDALPAGAKPHETESWDFVTKPDHPVYSGRSSLRQKANGLRQFVFENAGNRLKVG